MNAVLISIVFLISRICCTSNIDMSERKKNIKFINEANSVQKEIDLINSNSGEFKINKNHLIRSPQKLFIDIGVIVQGKIEEEIENNGSNFLSFFNQVFKRISQMSAWHNMEFNVVEFKTIFFHIPVYHSYQDLIGSIEHIFHDKNQKYLDLYIVYYSPDINHHGDIKWNQNFCQKNSIFLISLTQLKKLKYSFVAEITFNAIIYNLVTKNDTTKTCQCPYDYNILCINSYKSIYTKNSWPVKAVADCNMNELIERSYNQNCLYDKVKSPRYFKNCGDGVVDEDEECDCGFEDLCKVTGQNKCCDYKKCKFIQKDYECSYGLCCDECKFKKGDICRKDFGECDLPERCDGKSSECPKDLIVEHYSMCNMNQGFCYNGMCTNFDYLCKYIYNSDLFYYDDQCYLEVAKHLSIHCKSKDVSGGYLYLCQRKSICNHFLCATNAPFQKPNIIVLHRNNISCLIPNFPIAIGAFRFAPNYLQCSDNSNYFCYNSSCIDDKNILPNCKDGRCHIINNKTHYMMNKKLPLYNWNSIYFTLGIYEFTTIEKKVPFKLSFIQVGIITLFIVVIIIFMPLILFWRRKNRRSQKIFSRDKYYTEVQLSYI